MGNCCTCVHLQEETDPRRHDSHNKGRGHNRRHRHRKERRPNPFSENPSGFSPVGAPVRVLKDVVPFSHRTRITDKYVLGRELGRGEFGITYLCTDRETREALACKSISKKKLRTAVDVEDVRREVAIMSSLPDHPSVVRLRATYEDADNVHLVMELCEGGELFDRIVARGHYSERAAAAVARTVAEVVRMCHENGVMHRDLKPENFLFANKRENAPLKAIDFGLSVFFRPGERFSEIVGSPYYMAPEVLKRNYGPEVDIWSAGVILYILLCGVPPFWAETEQGVAQAILRGVIDFKRDPWPKISESAKSLVRQMLEPDPRRRLTAQQVLEHSWLQNAKKASNVPLGDIVRARLKQFAVMNRFKKKAVRAGLFGASQETWMVGCAEHPNLGKPSQDDDAWFKMFASASVFPTNRDGAVSTNHSSSSSLQPQTNILVKICANVAIHAKDALILESSNAKILSVDVKVIAEHLSLEEVEVIKDMFKLMDTDNNGKITFDELKAGLQKVGSQLGEPEMKMMMEAADVDGNGTLDYGEFVAVTIHLQRMENDEHFRRAFMFFDTDGSGYIEMDELREALMDESGETDSEVLNDIMREVDTDKDGHISYEEFVAMMKAGTDWRKASRHYSRERFRSLSIDLMKDGSLKMGQ